MSYINKDAIVAEIERRKKELIEIMGDNFANRWACGSLDNILSFINTLEIKEINEPLSEYNFLEEVSSYFKGWGKYPSVVLILPSISMNLV